MSKMSRNTNNSNFSQPEDYSQFHSTKVQLFYEHLV